MARVVGVVALVLVCTYATFAFGAEALGNILRRDILTYSANYANDTRDIFSIDTLTGETIQLTHSGDVSGYAWSPNGRMLAVEMSRTGLSSYIDILDERGRRVTAIGREPAGVMNPVWLSDSETLLFLYPSARSALYTAHINDAENWQVAGEGWYENVAISPDGNAMIFVSDAADGLGLATINMNTGEYQEFWDDGREPAWSPDNQWIAYTSQQSDIYIINIQDKIPHQLTSGSSFDSQPAWSPDGTQIAFASDRDGDYDIYIMNADGSDVRQVTFNDVDDTNPAWVP